MKEKVYTIGERVEKICPECDEQLGHIVKSVTKLGRISRVTCSKCSNVGTFKSSTKVKKSTTPKAGKGSAYDSTKTYRTGQVMLHDKFGVGEVTAVHKTRIIDVLFEDRVRRLIHSRP